MLTPYIHEGRIILNSETSASLDFDDIPDLLGTEVGSSFNFTSQRVSKLNPSKIYYQYQQYHEGVKVDNGGYTILAAPNFGTQPGCDQSGIYGISPAIATGININTTAAISQEEATASVGNTTIINTSELSIAWGLTEENTYHLTYKIDFWEDNTSYRAWIDAHNGSILKKVDVSMNLEATTFIYGGQNLDDTTLPNGGGTKLETEDGVLSTYNFPDNLTPFFGPNYTEDLIPITNNEQLWDDPAIRIAVWQGHFCATNIIPVFNELIDGVDEFTKVKLGISTSSNRHSQGAAVATDAHMDNAMVGIGNTENGIHLALHDVIAHELAHIFLSNYLSTEEIGPLSLHEGIADMFATYIESVIQNDENIDLGSIPGGLDWVMGDDRPGAEARDLENPEFSTWEEVMNLTEEHDRGEVIGHWFYLISQGSGPGFQVPIPPLGIERAMNIVLEALLVLNNTQADYPDFMEVVEMAVDLNWDPCSMETTSVRRAFKRIGLGNSETCAFVNVKPRYCESDATMQLCIEEGFSGDQYRWYFPLEWTVQGAGNTNSVQGNCLTVVDWPEYSYYPRNFNVRLFNITQNVNLNYNIRMEDCEGDDPGCNDVESNTPPTSETAEEKDDKSVNSDTFHLLKVFDINGRKVYEGKNINQGFRIDNTDGLLIYCYYDSQGKVIETKKMITIK